MTNAQTMKQIENTIAEEQNKFNDAVYDGKLFKGFKVIFEKCLLSMPSFFLKIPTKMLKAIVAKKENQLTNWDVATMNNLLSNVVLRELHSDLSKALELREQIEGVTVEYNLKQRKKQEQLSERKANMIALSGVNITGSKIVPLN